MRAKLAVACVVGIAMVHAGSAPASAQGAQGPSAAAATADQICASCHGPKGNSASPAFPRLAGQQKAYLEAQLKAFRDRTRGDPMAQAYMWGMTAQLSDDTIEKLASYYAAQKPVPAKRADPKLTKEGLQIFSQGIPSQSVPACSTCHGSNGEGNAVIPRLADQHAEYVLKQLVVFKSHVRADVNAPPMHTVTNTLTFEQMQAIAAYVSRIGR